MPTIDGKTLDLALTSNSAYNTTLNYVHLSHDASIPGYDYTFLNSQYPLPVHDDLETQVNKFLESKPPRNPPKETLWIFNFGFWDIWALSSMPREIAEVAINRTVSDMFQQIEILYKASLVESSIAFSDFWGYSDPDIIEKLENNQLSDVRGEREMFRVLIPRVVDPSITPGWESMRPRPPSPHSLAVHMTNAAYLTERWNDAIWLQMDRWEKLPNPVPAESIATGSERAEARKRDLGPSDRKRSAADTRNRENKQQEPSFDLEPLLAPFPRRQSMDFNGFNFVREVLIEGQFRGAGFTDMLGRGQRDMESLMYYNEAWRPCSEGDLDAKPRFFSQRISSNENGTCASPDNVFWDTPFLLGNKAAHTLARFAATEASIRLSL